MKTEKVNITLLNQTNFDIYIKPSNDWIKYEQFDIQKLNLTWNVTSFNKD
jgi:hypothetical protein